MYENIAQTPQMRRDWRLAASIAGVMVLSLVLLTPLILSMRLMYRFHVYVQELAVSFVYGEEEGMLDLHISGEAMDIGKEQASRLYSLITEAGMGHPRSSVPEEEGITLAFGDGCVLQLWPTEIAEKGRKNDTGVLIRYTKPDGGTFTYSTDRLQYRDCVRALGG